jgi:prepilin-type processing-associated H-X9-DG protein
MSNDRPPSSVALEYARPGTALRPINVAGVTAAVLGGISFLLFAVVVDRNDHREFIPPSFGLAVGAMAFGVAALYLGRADSVAAARRRRWTGLAALGLFLGAVPLVMISLGAPSRPRGYSNRDKCKSNLRQIGQAAQLYANENEGRLPDDFAMMLMTQDIVPAVFDCPSTNDRPAMVGATTQATAANMSVAGHCSYVYLGKYWMVDELTENVVLAYEPLSNHANNGMNVLYGDGRVDWVDLRGAKKLLGELDAGHNPPRGDRLK